MDQPLKKKSLGQYFTGKPLAYLLSHLCFAPSQQRVIDPMCGVGDMLLSYARLNEQADLVGIEIDPAFFDELTSHPKRFSFFNGNAFDLTTLKKIGHPLFDLVITNPPYVRYQTLSKGGWAELPVLNAGAIRQNLLDFVEGFPFEDPSDRGFFKLLMTHYSGLSDLAVPSWLLCAMLTKIGGTLALVVPETWLNREYAQIVQYLLLRWFRISYVIEDANSVWFPEAQVKTTLLIAERIPRKASAFMPDPVSYLHVSIRAGSGNSHSIVGKLFPQYDCPEAVFADHLRSGTLVENEYLTINKISLAQKAELLKRKASKSKWLALLESDTVYPQTKGAGWMLPFALQDWADGIKVGFKTLEDYGVKVGQGLRTGANKFFYVDLKEEFEDSWMVVPHKIFLEKTPELEVPKSCLEKVVRKQEELPESYQLKWEPLRAGVLVFRKEALPEDLEKIQTFQPALAKHFHLLPTALAEFISYASNKNIGSEREPKYIPNLSAVAPNAKPVQSTSPGFWYMLPPLKARHRPDLFVPRINNRHPKTMLNATPKTVIDANFSTIWIHQEVPKISKHALLALLNSDWSYCLMEFVATVMGGGALKLEASHIRQLPLPDLSGEQLDILDTLGRQLAEAEQAEAILLHINQFLMEVLFGAKPATEKLSQLRELMNQKQSERV